MRLIKIKILILGAVLTMIFYCGKGKNPLLFFPDQNTSQTDQNNSNSNETNTNTNNNSENSNANTQVNDQYGDLNYNFQTILNVNLNILVKDPEGPVAGAVVSIFDPINNNPLYQAITNSSGMVAGFVQVSTNLANVNLTVQVADVNLQFIVPVSQL
ncbi:MAG: hypothetical protein ACK4UJ_09940, partial [Leptonema sp. (in: bacteria)]